MTTGTSGTDRDRTGWSRSGRVGRDWDYINSPSLTSSHHRSRRAIQNLLVPVVLSRSSSQKGSGDLSATCCQLTRDAKE
jgi:hypothetical protein